MSDDLDWNKAIVDYDNRRKKEKEAKKMNIKLIYDNLERTNSLN